MTNQDDVIYLCDIANRIEELQSSDELDQYEADELAILTELYESLLDQNGGDVLIRESHFEDYARQLAESIGAVHDSSEWPCNRIDWEAAADDLLADYSRVDFDGVSYLRRS